MVPRTLKPWPLLHLRDGHFSTSLTSFLFSETTSDTICYSLPPSLHRSTDVCTHDFSPLAHRWVRYCHFGNRGGSESQGGRERWGKMHCFVAALFSGVYA
ncbi:unnamed protein product [Boreogadus saida]